MNTTSNYPECSKPVALSSLQGVCPECMLKVGLATQIDEHKPGVAPNIKSPPLT